MTIKTYQLPLDFEQILNLVRQLSSGEKEQIRQELEKEADRQQSAPYPKNDFLMTFDRIGKEAQDKGLTEEILAGLLADES
ncbi:hypothetical protein [Chamaesiphon polymorphus]|uniref:Uncharacterized protein n=1 Tax=Chamaesiphon polymorphus CCALA 037 TaxID=2107692 RepID=A0A2T1GFY3_9CYAN|nr:hypothetical protein [Chamaesiphon polymorphus]PSB56472.1 hypothetical protein C7B77_11770 [Chamaesiphon polymorphus CCALA 037]